MNIIKSFNSTIDYLETVLDDKIDEKKVTQLSGYSYSMFSRLFSILTEMTLSEYLRSRRLTEAAVILRNTNEKIIDIAFRFGYESSDSFGTAFKNFHGFTPSEVRNGKPFKLVSRVQLALSVRGGRSMNITIQKKKAFTVAGLNEQSINSSLCPSVWDKLYEKYSYDELASLGSGEIVGVCHDVENPNTINYMAAYIVNDVNKARDMGLEVLEVEETEYAVVELIGAVPECIHNG
ncbi:MAG TPA: AraC family transcriptional regulator, partial [Kandleria vitulina]|nr:AraC family transcriptional regulator [Kandleria vitulina]